MIYMPPAAKPLDRQWSASTENWTRAGAGDGSLGTVDCLNPKLQLPALLKFHEIPDLLDPASFTSFGTNFCNLRAYVYCDLGR